MAIDGAFRVTPESYPDVPVNLARISFYRRALHLETHYILMLIYPHRYKLEEWEVRFLVP